MGENAVLELQQPILNLHGTCMAVHPPLDGLTRDAPAEEPRASEIRRTGASGVKRCGVRDGSLIKRWFASKDLLSFDQFATLFGGGTFYGHPLSCLCIIRTGFCKSRTVFVLRTMAIIFYALFAEWVCYVKTYFKFVVYAIVYRWIYSFRIRNVDDVGSSNGKSVDTSCLNNVFLPSYPYFRSSRDRVCGIFLHWQIMSDTLKCSST